MAKKKLREAVCRHCDKPIYYSDFTGCWLHWESADRNCRRSSVAEPKE